MWGPVGIGGLRIHIYIYCMYMYTTELYINVHHQCLCLTYENKKIRIIEQLRAINVLTCWLPSLRFVSLFVWLFRFNIGKGGTNHQLDHSYPMVFVDILVLLPYIPVYTTRSSMGTDSFSLLHPGLLDLLQWDDDDCCLLFIYCTFSTMNKYLTFFGRK